MNKDIIIILLSLIIIALSLYIFLNEVKDTTLEDKIDECVDLAAKSWDCLNSETCDKEDPFKTDAGLIFELCIMGDYPYE